MSTPTAGDSASDKQVRSARWGFWCAFGIAIVTFAVYFPVLQHWFVHWDDDFFILRNPDINNPTLSSLAKFWAHPLEGYCQFEVPMNYTTWWALAHLARIPATVPGNAVLIGPAYHALNLGFHIIAAVAAFLILRKLTSNNIASAIGALVFSLHPMQAEPVSWAANMYTSLSGCLALLAMLSYLRFTESRVELAPLSTGGGDDEATYPKSPRQRLPGSSRTGWTFFALATFLYTLALLSKPSVSFLPVAIILVELTLRNRSIRSCIPLALWLVIGFIDGLLTHHIQSGVQAYVPPVWQRFFVAGDSLTFYLAKTLLPFRLIPDYGRSPQMVLHTGYIWFAWIVPALLGLLCFARRKANPWLLCGYGLFVLGVLPMLGLLPFDFQAYSTVADRYAYLALFGVAVLIAYAWIALGSIEFTRQTRVAITGGTIALLAFFGFLAREQTNTWQDTGTLFHHTLAINARSHAANLQLGYVLLNRGGPAELEEALDHYQVVLEDMPNDPHLLANIALTLRKLNRPAEAAAYFDAALKLDPTNADLEGALAQAQYAAGDKASAAAHFRSLAARFPNGKMQQAAIDPH